MLTNLLPFIVPHYAFMKVWEMSQEYIDQLDNDSETTVLCVKGRPTAVWDQSLGTFKSTYKPY